MVKKMLSIVKSVSCSFEASIKFLFIQSISRYSVLFKQLFIYSERIREKNYLLYVLSR